MDKSTKKNDIIWLDTAKFYANKRSKDPSVKVGCFIIRPDNTLASAGYNGFPKGYPDVNYEDREYKRKRVVHAEVNAILHSRESLNGCTLYSSVAPCGRCMTQIAQVGIKRIVSYDHLLFRESLDHDVTVDLCSKLGIELVVWHDRDLLNPSNDHVLVYHVCKDLSWPYVNRLWDYRECYEKTGNLNHDWLTSCGEFGCC